MQSELETADKSVEQARSAPASSLPVLSAGASVCESCGGPFECGAGLGDCWCAELKLSEGALRELRSRFSKCLCRACLSRFEEGLRG